MFSRVRDVTRGAVPEQVGQILTNRLPELLALRARYLLQIYVQMVMVLPSLFQHTLADVVNSRLLLRNAGIHPEVRGVRKLTRFDILQVVNFLGS